MTEDEIIEFIAGLPGVDTQLASEADGSPQVAWGDSFFFYDPERDIAADRRFPFATIVTKDYGGFDEVSNLNRDGIFRLNVSVDRHKFEELFGYQPGDHADHADEFDYTVIDTVLPHPTYARQAWVSILNPGERTSDQARSMIADARDRAASRHKPAP